MTVPTADNVRSGQVIDLDARGVTQLVVRPDSRIVLQQGTQHIILTRDQMGVAFFMTDIPAREPTPDPLALRADRV